MAIAMAIAMAVAVAVMPPMAPAMVPARTARAVSDLGDHGLCLRWEGQREGNSGEDGGYVLKVLAEQQRLKDIASGRQVSTVSSKTPAEDGLVDLADKAKILSPINPANAKP